MKKLKELKKLEKRLQNNHEKIMKLLQQIQEGTLSEEEIATQVHELYTERGALNEEFERIAL